MTLTDFDRVKWSHSGNGIESHPVQLGEVYRCWR